MDTQKRAMDRKVIGHPPEDPARIHKTEFRVLGEEMIEKEVKTSGKTGRVYLPGNWVGRFVKIIRMD
jgi:hypothetical protein